MSKTNNIYKVVNNDRNTNWKVGVEIKRLSRWSNEEDSSALFTCVDNPGAAIHAHISELEIVRFVIIEGNGHDEMFFHSTLNGSRGSLFVRNRNKASKMTGDSVNQHLHILKNHGKKNLRVQRA